MILIVSSSSTNVFLKDSEKKFPLPKLFKSTNFSPDQEVISRQEKWKESIWELKYMGMGSIPLRD